MYSEIWQINLTRGDGRPECGWEDTIKINLKQIGHECAECTYLALVTGQ